MILASPERGVGSGVQMWQWRHLRSDIEPRRDLFYLPAAVELRGEIPEAICNANPGQTAQLGIL